MDISTLVLSYDGYSDLWDTFFACYDRYWPRGRFPTYLVTNQKAPEYSGVQVLKTGPEISWSRKVRTALEHISSKYILVLLEDYYLHEPVDVPGLQALLQRAMEEDLDYLRLLNIPKSHRFRKKGYYPISTRQLYGVNLQGALWKREYLQKLLFADDFSAWEFEARQKQGSSQRIGGKVCTVNYPALNYLNGVIQGKVYPITLKKLRRRGIEVPIGARGVLGQGAILKMKASNFLLHHTPLWAIRLCKPVLARCGMKFVTKE